MKKSTESLSAALHGKTTIRLPTVLRKQLGEQADRLGVTLRG